MAAFKLGTPGSPGGLGARLLVSAVAGPSVLALVWVGGVPLRILVALAAGAAAVELGAMLAKAYLGPQRALLVLLSAALATLSGVVSAEVELALLSFGLVAALAWSLADHSAGPAGWALTVSGALLVGGLLGMQLRLRDRPDGLWWSLAVLLGTWACDTAAFAVGRLAGRTPLAPRISPKKTREGLVGALLITPLIPLGLAWLGPRIGVEAPHSPWIALGLGLAVAGAATLGDLSESWLKRQCGVKDSGVLLPGHGGLLDRIDGLLFAGLAGYGVALAVRP